MATSAYIDALLGGIDTGLRRVLKTAFEYVLGNLRVGRAEDRKRSENFQSYAYKVTTPATANAEFSIAHGLGRAPYLLIPVLAVEEPGEQLVELTVSKAADAQRVYLKSPVTNATIRVFLEV